MSETAFMVATAVVVAVGVALRRLLPRDGAAAATPPVPLPSGRAG